MGVFQHFCFEKFEYFEIDKIPIRVLFFGINVMFISCARIFTSFVKVGKYVLRCKIKKFSRKSGRGGKNEFTSSNTHSHVESHIFSPATCCPLAISSGVLQEY